MNTLKKNIVYWFIIITAVVVMAEGYLFYFLSFVLPKLIPEQFVTQTFIGALALFAGLTFTFLSALFFNRKIKLVVEKEAVRQVKERNILFANIAHDLKNPMSSILGYARALESGNVADDETDKAYKTICNKSLQINDMINKLFQYAKMESEGYSLKVQERDLSALLRELVADCYNDIEEKDMILEINIPDDIITYPVDSMEFGRAIRNLISNAVKHNDSGTKILIELKKADKILINIADNGKQISDEISHSIFDPFQCSDESRVAKNGSGLGLAITKRIIELHGGEILLNNRFDDYTKSFTIIL